MPQREKSMSGMRVLFVFLSFFVFSSAQAEVRQNAGKPLSKLLSLALSNSPEILNAKRTLEIARLDRANSTAELLPKIDLDSSHGYYDRNPRALGDDNNPWTSTLKLGLSETFYDNGVSFTRRKIALQHEKRAELEYALAKDGALTKLAEVYFRWSSAFQSVRIQEEQRETVDRQFKLIRSQYRQGIRSRRDVLRIESESRRAQIDRIKAENVIKTTELELSRLVGIPIARFEKEGILPYEAPKGWTPPPLPAQVDLKTHPRTRALDLEVQEADLLASLTTREYWPELGLNGNVAYNANNYMGTGQRISDNDFVDWQAMVTLKYNLFDFGIRKRNSQKARLEAGTIRDTNRGRLLELETDLRSQFISLKESRDNIQLTRELLDLERQNFAAQETDYRNGRASFVDLSTALESLNSAKVSFNTNFFEFKTQQVNYAFHQGRVEDFFLAQ